MRHEVNNTSQQVAALRDELERRLKDLVQAREERDALHVSRPLSGVCICF
jgi:uncharacterized coiled-coil DUF342 family protein